MSLLSRLAVEAARGFGMLARVGAPTNVPADYLVVAGGGSGSTSIGFNEGAGGGGAGGYLTSTFTLSTLNTYIVTVGAGGAGSGSYAGGNGGSNSVISGTGLTTVTSIGGGRGNGDGNGLDGGSGGGAGAGVSLARSGGAGTVGQGNNGGNGFPSGTVAFRSGGGGGGASAVGANGASAQGGAGGAGTASSITGTSVTYAAGGGGSSQSAGASGGSSIGGNGQGLSPATSTTSGTVNRGAGGGGSVNGTSGSGGSGVVIISYTSATPRFVGGTITTSGGKQIHTFTSTGALTPITPVTANYLVVAGGGGTAGNRGGGAGAGGLISGSTTLYSNGTYIVTVGAGGAGGAGNAAVSSTQDGSSSVLSGIGLSTLTAVGGGGAGGDTVAGRSGGSGGGGAGNGFSGGSATSGQGSAGGNGATNAGGGGGGAGAVGSNASSGAGANGGNGTASSISGTSVTYAGGGGGGATSTAGSGGSGGGGAGAAGSPSTQTSGSNGTQNTGGGAGGGSNYLSTPVTQASGGSGTVLISYAGTPKFNGGIITSSGGNTIHTFNATGALTPLTGTVNNSLRFQSASSTYLSRTPSSNGNRQKFTFSYWAKRGTLSTGQEMYFVNSGSGNFAQISWNSSNQLDITSADSSVAICQLVTTPVYRDPSAWYHIVFSVDTTQATASNRVKIYVNGSQVTALATATYPSLNYNFQLNNTTEQNIGRPTTGTFDGYLTEVNFIDGQALEPYYFGSNDANGTWCAIPYYGMYGTNGFYLPFSNGTSTSTLGADSSGNGNNWTLNNFTRSAGTSDCWMIDVPSGNGGVSGTQPSANYAVLNPIGNNIGFSVTNGNLTIANGSTPRGTKPSSFFVTSGKWYWEVLGNGYAGAVCGTTGASSTLSLSATGSNGIGYWEGGLVYWDGGNSGAGPASYTSSDVIGIALNMDVGTVAFYKNNSLQYTATFGSGTVPNLSSGCFPCYSDGSSVAAKTANFNFGQRSFAYTPPTGFKALCTANLPAATIKQGNQFMDATTYTGSGTTNRAVVNAANFAPDLVWVKDRSNSASHLLVDSVRGASAVLYSNSTLAEQSGTPIASLNSNGFSVNEPNVGADSSNINGRSYVGWQWDAGSSTVTNTSGSISSQVRANPTAGVSVVTWTGTFVNATVGHGLGIAPSMIIVKRRDSTGAWPTYHSSLSSPATGTLYLNTTNARVTTTGLWNSTLPTSSVFNIGQNTDVNASGGTYVAYCFSEIAGFSKFGSYTGNFNADGPFVYLGFRPKYVMIKCSSTGGAGFGWFVFDSVRNTYNVLGEALYPDLSNAAASGDLLDFTSNGFKLRSNAGSLNLSAGTFIYMAFAENPFANANAR